MGAGTGNDVAAALRPTDRLVTAVEIDPTIAGSGAPPPRAAVLRSARHAGGRRRTVVLPSRAKRRYAIVVFGFLDSHRLLSAFWLGSARQLHLHARGDEGGAAAAGARGTGCAQLRDQRALDPRALARARAAAGSADASGRSTLAPGYPNGILYLAERGPGATATGVDNAGPLVPTDDWPFLYLRERSIPSHNVVFLLVALALSACAFLVLPRGERRIRVPYFLLGAAFFLLETSNVVRMALLFGSTWAVNTVVFAGILALVLLANLTASRWRIPISACVDRRGPGDPARGGAGPVGLLLELPFWARAAAAVVVYLGPVFFGGLIFARLIENEPRLFEAYGSNVLGAVLGGSAEYLSLVLGFRFLLALALAFYLGVFLLLRRRTSRLETA